MSNVLKDRFKDEVTTISGYVDYIENNFYRRSCQVLRTQGFEDFEVLKDYVFFTDDETEHDSLAIEGSFPHPYLAHQLMLIAAHSLRLSFPRGS